MKAFKTVQSALLGSLRGSAAFLTLASFTLTACNFQLTPVSGLPGSENDANTYITLDKFVERATIDWHRCEAAPFNEFSNLNVFVSGNFTAPSADTQGRLAVGGNAFIMNYSVGDQLAKDANRIDLIVGGDLDFRSGAVESGSATYGGSLITTQAASVYGELTQDNDSLDFARLTADAMDLSVYLGKLKPNGDVIRESYGARGFTDLKGYNPVLNIVGLTTEELERTHTMRLSAPADSTMIVNIYGETAVMTAFEMQLTGITRDHVIFNFVDATRLYISNISVEGSVLAPRAVVQYPAGQLNGHFMAASMEGSGQFNLVPFKGCIPVTDEPNPTPTPGPSPSPSPNPVPSPTPSPTPSGANCTLTIGYWKTHSGEKKQDDMITPLLPQNLGLEYSGSKRLLVTTSAMAVDVLSQDVYGSPSNGITKLYAQLLASRLNIKHGASASVVSATIERSDVILGQYNYNDWSLLTSTLQNEILSLHAKLDDYNNGNIGPGHCL